MIPEGEVYSISVNGVIIWQVANYLSVSPSETQWLTPDNEIIYQVESNTDWIIT